MFASRRPLYWTSVVVNGFRVVKFAMSATFDNPLPMPGLLGPVHVRSCVPSVVVSGDPRFKPCPGIVRQFTFSVRPIFAHVSLIIPAALTPAPGKVRNFDAMLLAGANASKAEVSYHPVAVVDELFRIVSYAKKAKILSFQMGPPTLPPIWLNCCVSFSKPLSAGVPGCSEPGPL